MNIGGLDQISAYAMNDADATVDALVAAMLASHGDHAGAVVCERIETSALTGDIEGLKIWRKIAEKISARGQIYWKGKSVTLEELHAKIKGSAVVPPPTSDASEKK